MSWLHTWAGLLLGWLLYFIFLTGTTGYFDAEIDRWMRPELPLASGSPSREQLLIDGLARLKAIAPEALRWTVELPNREGDSEGRIAWRNVSKSVHEDWDFGAESLTGTGHEPRKTGGGQLLYQMHYRLHYLDPDDAAWVVGLCAMMMLVAIVTGVIAHRRIFRDFFTFRPGTGQRSWLDAHNLMGVVALPFHFMITYSGLVFFMYMYMPYVLEEVYRLDNRSQGAFFEASYPAGPMEIAPSGVRAPLTDVLALVRASSEQGGELMSVSIRNPGDSRAQIVITRKQQRLSSQPLLLRYDGVTGRPIAPDVVPMMTGSLNEAIIGLHEGLFAGWFARWLYFFSGLLGTGAIATGLVLWTLKRRAKAPSHPGLWIVERVNVGTLIGLPIGIAAYFWANRLLPLDLDRRGVWEAHVLFGAWALTFIFCAFRSPRRSWVELLALACGLYALLPVLNALTTERHLGITLPAGDWALAGFDLTAGIVGIAFGMVVWSLRRRRVTAESSGRGTRTSYDSLRTPDPVVPTHRITSSRP